METVFLIDEKYNSHLKTLKSDWVLCVGAGICSGIAPDWYRLTWRVINKCYKRELGEEEFRNYCGGNSFDSVLQRARSYCQERNPAKYREEFNGYLNEELYRDLQKKAEEEGVGEILQKMFTAHRHLSYEEMSTLCTFFEQSYGQTSLMQLVNILLKSPQQFFLPSAVITLNADTLLYLLLSIFNRRNYCNETGNLYQLPKEKFQKITVGHTQIHNKIPIYHIHGALTPGNSSPDRGGDLIFIEDSYSDISNKMYSWSQTTFLFFAQSHVLVFVGLSMQDPNIKKWLNWTTKDLNEKILRRKKTGEVKSVHPHLWITMLDPKNISIQRTIDHLGIRVKYIENWNDIGPSLENIMCNPNVFSGS